MAETTECPSCGVEVEVEDNTCPLCGYEFPVRTGLNMKWGAGALLILFIALLYRFYC